MNPFASSKRGRQSAVSRALLIGGLAASLLAHSVGAQANALPASSIVDVRTFGQLCAGSCADNTLFSHSQVLYETSGDLSVWSGWQTSGVTPVGQVAVSGEGDLASGTLRVVAASNGINSPGVEPNAYAYASSSVILGDTFSVYNNNRSPYSGNGISYLTVDIDGTFLGNEGSDLWLALQVRMFKPGGFQAWLDQDWATFSALSIGSGSYLNFSAGDTLPADWIVAFTTPSEPFEMWVAASASFSYRQNDEATIFAVADLGHTLTLDLQTPDGTYFSTASNLFPGSSQGPSTVPEPASMALVSIALGLMGVASRRPKPATT